MVEKNPFIPHILANYITGESLSFNWIEFSTMLNHFKKLKAFKVSSNLVHKEYQFNTMKRFYSTDKIKIHCIESSSKQKEFKEIVEEVEPKNVKVEPIVHHKELDYNSLSNGQILDLLMGKKLAPHKLEEVLKDKTRAVHLRRMYSISRSSSEENLLDGLPFEGNFKI